MSENGHRVVYTLGHSTRTLAEFIELLIVHSMRIVADVRRWPASRRYPHFNRDNLTASLAEKDIAYEWLGEDLGGFRRMGLGEASPNKAWRNEGFRNYADHALTEEFGRGLSRLIELAERDKTAFVCAERSFLRCHRRIISDHLTVKGWHVVHIMGQYSDQLHGLTTSAVVKNETVIYPS